MSIYDEVIDARDKPRLALPSFSLPKLPNPSKAIPFLILFIVLLFVLYGVLTYVPKEISVYEMHKNFSLSKDSETFLRLEIVNNSENLEKEVLVQVSPYSEDFFIIYPKTETLKTIASSEKRYVDFIIRPKPFSGIVEGSYKFKAEVLFDDRKDSIDFELKIIE